jgi:hypothetical protein
MGDIYIKYGIDLNQYWTNHHHYNHPKYRPRHSSIHVNDDDNHENTNDHHHQQPQLNELIDQFLQRKDWMNPMIPTI